MMDSLLQAHIDLQCTCSLQEFMEGIVPRIRNHPTIRACHLLNPSAVGLDFSHSYSLRRPGGPRQPNPISDRVAPVKHRKVQVQD